MTMFLGIKQIRILIILPVAVLIIGTAGFMLLENWMYIQTGFEL